MDEVKRKVYLDLFASPLTLIPLAGGLTSLMAAWATGGNPTLTLAGIVGVLGSLGITISRMILGLEGITERAVNYRLEKQQKERESALDRLFQKLQQDRDPRTETCLQELRLLVGSLQTAAEKGNITTSAYEILDGVGNIFNQCVKQLEHSHALWETARRMHGPAGDSLLGQRDDVVREVCQTVEEVSKKVDRYLLTETQRNRSDLAKLRRELDESIEAARRAEQRTAELERTARADAVRFERS